MVTKKTLKDRNEWLEARKKTIGGSDAAAVIGLSPWMSNAELWDIKSGKVKQKDISETEAARYGTEAEALLRGLYSLDFPEMKVFYEPDNIFHNDLYPWAHCSLDGWLEDEKSRRGVLEIKTANVMSGAQYSKWINKVPDHYFCQVLHNMAVYDADFAVLKAYLRRTNCFLTVHYTFEREEVEEQMVYLMEQEKAFCQSIEKGERPGLILPEL